MKRERAQTKQVKLDRFAELVEAYGANPKRWPEDERDAALMWLESSEDARRLVEEANHLDRWLESAGSITPSPALKGRIMAQMPRVSEVPLSPWMRWVERIWPFGPTWQPVAALVAAAMLGVTFGVVMPESDESSSGGMVVAEVLLDMGDLADDWNEGP
ncbi:MAG TPA: hypothetical protein PK710_08825 [Polyangiaceae bacterium]|nr:hypothetical protein [Polyangiaceae bacterium]